jgi:hypothetical protein
MESAAQGIIGLTTSLKRARDDLNPLKEQLIDDMKTRDVKTLKVGDKEIVLVEKKSRPALGIKKLMTLVKDELGAANHQKLQAAIEKSRKAAKITHSIKIVDASE